MIDSIAFSNLILKLEITNFKLKELIVLESNRKFLLDLIEKEISKLAYKCLFNYEI